MTIIVKIKAKKRLQIVVSIAFYIDHLKLYRSEIHHLSEKSMAISEPIYEIMFRR